MNRLEILLSDGNNTLNITHRQVIEDDVIKDLTVEQVLQMCEKYFEFRAQTIRVFNCDTCTTSTPTDSNIVWRRTLLNTIRGDKRNFGTVTLPYIGKTQVNRSKVIIIVDYKRKRARFEVPRRLKRNTLK